MSDTRWFAARRMAWFFLAMVVLTTVAVHWSSQPAYAEEAAAEKAEGGEAAAPAGEAEAGTEGPKQIKSGFMWFIESSGLIGLFILILSIYFVATVSRLFWEFRLQIAMPPELVARVQELLAQRDFKGVFAAVKDDDSLYARLLTTGISELPNGLAEARDAVERVNESIRVEMEKRISILAVLGTLGPMIGLLGTLKGMIASFSVIAMYETTMKASQVAGGISEALLLTFEGVALSVPAIYFFSLFRNRVSVITTTAGLEADQFLRHFAHAARAKAPGGGGGGAAGAGGAKVATRLD